MNSRERDTMAIRQYCIVYVMFAFVSFGCDAITFSNVDYTQTGIDQTYQPGKLFGQMLGNMVLSALQRNPNQQLGLNPSGIHDIGAEFGKTLADPAGVNNGPMRSDSVFNDQYNTRTYPYDDRNYPLNNGVPAQENRPNGLDKNVDYGLQPINARGNLRGTVDEEPYPITDNDANRSRNSYYDPASDLNSGVNERYNIENNFRANSRAADNTFEPAIDENIPQEPLVPPRDAETAQDNDMHRERINTNNDNGQLHTLTVKKFAFQAQPVKPESERNISEITVYYIE